MLRTSYGSTHCTRPKLAQALWALRLGDSAFESAQGASGWAAASPDPAPAVCRVHRSGRSGVTSSRVGWLALGLGPSAAFTLVEVLLGIFIAVGMLLAVLYLYRQSADLRAQLMEETERLMAVRLVMDRLTTELRCAHAPATARYPFVGQATTLQFATTAAATVPAWAAGSSSRSGLPNVGLKVVSYSLGTGRQGTNVVVSGLIRTEQPAVPMRGSKGEPPPPKAQEPAAEAEAEQDAAPTHSEASGAGSNATSAASSAPGSLRGLSAGTVQPVIEAIRFVRFRYRAAPTAAAEAGQPPKRWTGASISMTSLDDWQETWTGPGLPQAVEVSLGTEPLPPDVAPEDYPYELFRRVIYLPSHAAGGLWVNDSGTTQSESNPEPTP